jgi:hypothetical protein
MNLKRCFNRYIRVLQKHCLSRQAHTLRPRREWAYSDDLHLRVPVGNPALISMDLPLTVLVGVAGRSRKILICTQTKQKSQKQKIEQLRSTRFTRHDLKAMNSRHAKASSEIMDSSLLARTTNHF